jgi:hypothetical protein
MYKIISRWPRVLETLFVSLLILLVALSILCVHKKVFVQPDGVSITLLEEDMAH